MYQLPLSCLAQEVTTPSRFNRRQSTERNAAIGYGAVPSYFVTAWLVCSSKHLTNKLSNILLVQVQWKTETTHCSSFFATCKMTMTLTVYLLIPHQEMSKHHMFLPPRVYSPNHLLKKLLLQYKAVITPGNKDLLHTFFHDPVQKYMDRCVEKWWPIFPRKVRHFTTHKISLKFSPRFSQHTEHWSSTSPTYAQHQGTGQKSCLTGFIWGIST